MRFILSNDLESFWRRDYSVNQNTTLLIDNEKDPFHTMSRLIDSLIQEQREVGNLSISKHFCSDHVSVNIFFKYRLYARHNPNLNSCMIMLVPQVRFTALSAKCSFSLLLAPSYIRDMYQCVYSISRLILLPYSTFKCGQKNFKNWILFSFPSFGS